MTVMNGARVPFERTFFWRHDVGAAVRRGRWKYLKLDEKTEKLFDLSTDEREQADFSSTRADVLADLRGRYKQWESQMLKRPDSSSG